MNRIVTKKANRMSWAVQIVAAAILGQALFFKFSAAPEAMAMFRELGVEPWGRLLTGSLELIAVALLLTPRLAGLGGLLASGLMVGAIGAHLTRLGIAVGGDGGALFMMAVVTLVAGSIVAWIHRRDLPVIGPHFAEEPMPVTVASR